MQTSLPKRASFPTRVRSDARLRYKTRAYHLYVLYIARTMPICVLLCVLHTAQMKLCSGGDQRVDGEGLP